MFKKDIKVKIDKSKNRQKSKPCKDCVYKKRPPCGLVFGGDCYQVEDDCG